jgi:hypothetical protein
MKIRDEAYGFGVRRKKKSWLSRKWTAVKKWLQTFWNVGWELSPSDHESRLSK